MANFQGFNSAYPIIKPNSLSTSSVAPIPGGGPAFQNGPSFSLANLSPPGPSPEMTEQLAASANPQVLAYPADSPPYFFQLAISKYQRADWLAVGDATPFAWIVLPLPNSMLDEGGVDYDIEALGAAQGNALQALSLQNDILSQATVETALKAGVGEAQQAFVKATNSAALLAAAGTAVNQFMTVCLKGPTYKTRSFSWKFSPKTPAESETLRQIIQRLNNCSAPFLTNSTLGSAFFRWPMLFRPSFQFINLAPTGGSGGTAGITNVLGAQTFYMKFCTLKNWAYNYAPMDVPAFYTGTHAPQSVTISLVFQEIEFWLKDDYTINGPVSAGLNNPLFTPSAPPGTPGLPSTVPLPSPGILPLS